MGTINFNRILYLGYYFKKQDYRKFNAALSYVKDKTGRTKMRLFLASITDSLFFNVSPLESLQFEFFNKNSEEKSKWAGTGYMYEYQKVMNPVDKRQILDDKTLFYKKYQRFFLHNALDLEDMELNVETVEKMLMMPY